MVLILRYEQKLSNWKMTLQLSITEILATFAILFLWNLNSVTAISEPFVQLQPMEDALTSRYLTESTRKYLSKNVVKTGQISSNTKP